MEAHNTRLLTMVPLTVRVGHVATRVHTSSIRLGDLEAKWDHFPLTLGEGIDQVCPNRTRMLLATMTNLVTDSRHKSVP